MRRVAPNRFAPALILPLCLASAFFTAAGYAAVGPTVDEAMAKLANVHTFSETAISLDGQWVAWVEALPRTTAGESRGSAVYVAPRSVPANAHRVTAFGDAPAAVATKHSEQSSTWSADSKRLAFLSDAILASQGYFVFYPNPRGSAGSGEEFKAANVQDFGGGDLRDTLTGISQIVKTLPIDDARVGISGWS
jgi:hypothetical protein